jgi:exopolysaccharide biosynthesis polyprenyl glycosylphosphotransferase
MATGHPTAALGQARPPHHAGAGRPAVAEPDIRRHVLACRLLGDIGALLLGLMVAQGIQQVLLALGGPVRPLGPVAVFNTLAILIWLALFANAGLYDTRRLVNAADEFKLVMQAVATGTVAATFAAFALKVPTQRSWVLAAWAGCTVAVLITRFGYRLILRSMRHSGTLVSRMLIVGAGREGRDLCRAVTRARWLGFKVVGFLDDTRPPGPVAAGLPEVLGSSADVRQAVRIHRAHAVLVAGGSVATENTEQVYRDLQELPVDLHLSTGVLGVAASRVTVQRFDDVPVLGLRRVELTRWQRTLKRAFDLVVAGLLVVALSPVLLACAVAVRLSGPGPVLFRQRRFGKDGVVFHIHKFRSMVADAEDRQPGLRSVGNDADGPLFKLHRDPRVTPVGRILRAWSLDELPQLFDVLRGDMSLVGPRPFVTHEVDLSDPWARTRLRVKPGVTGLWQVSGRHGLPFDDLVRYDLFYVENWSLAMDLFVFLRTLPAVLRRSGV